ncbi:MAG: MgtC/SapB family protein [Clostridia bacterium]|nr:MgtC/SapB family protein [Clostridia bacterium]
MVAQQIFSDDLIILELVLRLFLALIIGFAIGFERKMRFKEAGIRTHTIVSIGSCLYMIISMFAFEGADTSRVAAQIVSGIGFLGAGMIFYHKEMVHGLTTAAGIWATAAIGMAAGAGWYILSIVATVLIILLQCVMHTNFKVFHAHHFVKVNLVYKDQSGNVTEQIKKTFHVERFTKISAKKDGEGITFSAVLSTDKILSAMEIQKLLTENPSIISIARQDDDF